MSSLAITQQPVMGVIMCRASSHQLPGERSSISLASYLTWDGVWEIQSHQRLWVHAWGLASAQSCGGPGRLRERSPPWCEGSLQGEKPGESPQSEKPWRRLWPTLAARGFPRSVDPQGWESTAQGPCIGENCPSIFMRLCGSSAPPSARNVGSRMLLAWAQHRPQPLSCPLARLRVSWCLHALLLQFMGVIRPAARRMLVHNQLVSLEIFQVSFSSEWVSLYSCVTDVTHLRGDRRLSRLPGKSLVHKRLGAPAFNEGGRGCSRPG